VKHANEIRYKRLLLFFDPLAHLLPLEQRTDGLWGLATDLCQCDNTELIEVDGGSGNIYYCRIRALLGNIWKDDLVKLWENHPMLIGLRRKSPEGACNGCSAWKSCRGGCPAVVYGNTGQAMLQDPDCHRVQEQDKPVQQFQGKGIYSVPAHSVQDSLRTLGKKLRDVAYWAFLR
jgi:radical SAM protein with 4Fe4S-binding SPASM domain